MTMPLISSVFNISFGMFSSYMKFNLHNEAIKCCFNVEEKRLIIATRKSLEIFYEEQKQMKEVEYLHEKSTTVVSHDAIFVRRQILKKNKFIPFIQAVTADSDGAIRGYHGSTGKLDWEIHPGMHFGELTGHTRDVVSIIKGPTLTQGSSPLLITCGLDGLAFTWNIDVREKVMAYDRNMGSSENRIPATSIVFCENMSINNSKPLQGIAVGYADGVICLFDFKNGKLLLTLNKTDKPFNVDEIISDPTELRSVPKWKSSVLGLFWSNVYQCIFASIGDMGVFGYDPACTNPYTPIAHHKMNCAYLRPMGSMPELGVGEEGVAAFVATDGRIILMRPTYSAARSEGHFIPVCTAFSLYEEPATTTFVVDITGVGERSLFIGCKHSFTTIKLANISSLLIHGTSEIVQDNAGSTTHKLDLELETALTEQNRYLSLIPEPLPNAIRYKLAEKEREIGLNTEGSSEMLEQILEHFKTIKTGKGQNNEEEEEKEEEKEEDPLNVILDFSRFRKMLKKITPEGVCPTDVLNTSISLIEDSLELLREISILFKVKIPEIDVEAMTLLTEEEMNALDNASAAMNTAYPTVGLETDTGVSTAESRQAMKIQKIPQAEIPLPSGPSVAVVVGGDGYDSNVMGLTDPNVMQTENQDDNLPPYMRLQKSNPYLSQYGGTQVEVQGNTPQPGIKKVAYSADAYATNLYAAPSSVQQGQVVYQEQQTTAHYNPAVLTSFDSFTILSRLVARSIALFIKRASIVDTRLLVTFGGREAKDLAISLGSADEEIESVKMKFDRQLKIIKSRQEEEISNIETFFQTFKQRFVENLDKEKSLVASRFELLRRNYNDRRNRAAKLSQENLMNTILKYFPRYTVISRRWVIIPSEPRSYPVFSAYDMLQDKFCSVHPVISQEFSPRLLFGLSNTKGIIRPTGIGRSEDAFKKVYVVTPISPAHTLRDIMDKMPRALHPHEVAHLIFPLVCTLARLQTLPGEAKTVIHRDIRPSTVFLKDEGFNFQEFVESEAPVYDPDAPTVPVGGVPSKQWPKPNVPEPLIYHLGVIRNCVMDEPIEFNTVFCAPEVMLGGVCECSDVWSVGLICLKLLLPHLSAGIATRTTRVAAPSGPLSPVIANRCTCFPSVAGYLTDVARLSGVYDRLNTATVTDIMLTTHMAPYGEQLMLNSLPMQQTSVSVNVTPNVDMSTYEGINAFVQQSGVGTLTGDPLEMLLPNTDAGTIQFIRECLTFNPRERPSPIKLAHHPWFREHGLLPM